jgi:hypothetical protein
MIPLPSSTTTHAQQRVVSEKKKKKNDGVPTIIAIEKSNLSAGLAATDAIIFLTPDSKTQL